MSAQSSPVNEPLLDAGHGQFLEMPARFAETNGTEPHLAHQKLLADQMAQGDASGDKIAAGLSLFDADIVVAGQRLDRFGFDESHLAVGLSRLAEGPLMGELAVALESAARDGQRLGYGPRLGRFCFGYVDSH